MKVIIAGSRKLKASLLDVIKAIKKSGFNITQVISGGAKGIDKLGEDYALINKIPIKRFLADWKNINVPGAVIKENYYGKYNAKAGFDRNLKMGEFADALVAIWDGESSGTRSMITI